MPTPADSLRAAIDRVREWVDAHFDDTELARAVRLVCDAAARALPDAEDAARVEWFFGPEDKGAWINEYLRGVREGWTVDQWRAGIDAARTGEPNAR